MTTKDAPDGEGARRAKNRRLALALAVVAAAALVTVVGAAAVVHQLTAGHAIARSG